MILFTLDNVLTFQISTGQNTIQLDIYEKTFQCEALLEWLEKHLSLSAARILQRLLAGAGRFSRLRVIVFHNWRRSTSKSTQCKISNDVDLRPFEPWREFQFPSYNPTYG